MTPPALLEGLPQSLAAPFARRRVAGAGERRAAGQRLEAADVAAAADDRGVVDDLDVPDVAGAALRAAMQRAVGDDPGADARPDLEHDDVLVPFGDPEPPLAEGQDVDVVVDPDRRAGGARRSDRGSDSRPSRA